MPDLNWDEFVAAFGRFEPRLRNLFTNQESTGLTRCDDCNTQTANRNLRASGAHTLCRTCIDRTQIMCCYCGQFYPRNLYIDTSRQFECASCVTQFVSCRVCNTRYHPSNSLAINDRDGNTIEVCSGECESTIRSICRECNQYHFVPYARCVTKFPDLPTEYVDCYLPNRQFSVELETNTIVPTPDGWSVVNDGSIDGKEYLSGPILGKSAIEFIEKGCEVLNANGPIINNKCGYHIHLNARDLSEEQVVQFLNFCHAYQYEVAKLVPKSRNISMNRFCRALIDRYGEDISLEEIVYPRRGGLSNDQWNYELTNNKNFKYHDARYFWVNAHSYYYRGTIEIRLHSGTTLPEKILNWAELWLKLLEYTISQDFTLSGLKGKDLFNVMSLAGVRESTIQFYRERFNKFGGKSLVDSILQELSFTENSIELIPSNINVAF